MKFKYAVTFNKKEYNLGSALLLILISLCLIISILLIKTIAENSRLEQRLCTSEECIRSAADIILAMNMSVDPCEDFYSFTCGRWNVEHRIQEGYQESSAFTIVHQKLVDKVLKFLKSNESVDEPTPLHKSRDMFRSCMDQETREKLKYEPVFKYLTLLGLPEVPRYFNMSNSNKDILDYKFDWMKTDIAMNTLLDLRLFVNCYVDQNIFNSSQNVILCGIPKSQQTLENIENNTSRKNYLNMKFKIKTLIQEKYDIPSDFEKKLNVTIAIIDDIENRILEAINLKRYSITDCQTTMSIDSLQNYTTDYLISNQIKPKLIWRQYLEELFRNSNLTLDLNNKENIQICPENIDYYKAIAGLISNELDAKIELWAWWRAVSELISYTTSTFYKIPTEIVCANKVMYYMEYPITYALTEDSFMNRTKPKVQEMWQNIKDAYELRAYAVIWMDDKMKNIIIQKSKLMADLIGFPEWLLDKNLLEIYYSTVTMNLDRYLDNVVAINRFKQKLTLERLSLNNNKEMLISPMTVNAFNTFIGNNIVIPFGIVNYPFFNHGIKVLNYATLGSLLGHELTHGFDNRGRKYDKEGNYRQWWNNKTIQKFNKLTKCFIDQFDSFYIPEVQMYINGTQTLGENLADNGGLHLAYLAYHSYTKKNKEELKLPGLEKFTSDQLFFISYANLWCEERSNDELIHFLKEDPHSPSKYRVLGNLMNSEEFANAFKCPYGSKMNPKSKCKLW